MCGGTTTLRALPDFVVSIRQVPRCVTARATEMDSQPAEMSDRLSSMTSPQPNPHHEAISTRAQKRSDLVVLDRAVADLHPVAEAAARGVDQPVAISVALGGGSPGSADESRRLDLLDCRETWTRAATFSPRWPPTPIASTAETHSRPSSYVTVTFLAVSPAPSTRAVAQHVHHHGKSVLCMNYDGGQPHSTRPGPHRRRTPRLVSRIPHRPGNAQALTIDILALDDVSSSGSMLNCLNIA
jgi:hypothetical protein